MSRAVVELYRDTVMEHQPRHGGGDKRWENFPKYEDVVSTVAEGRRGVQNKQKRQGDKRQCTHPLKALQIVPRAEAQE